MSFLRGAGRSPTGGSGPSTSVARAQLEERRATRSDRLCGGTLACARCDAPIAIGAAPMSPADPITCPFCDHTAPAREFLSLASPARPARVVVRVRVVLTEHHSLRNDDHG